MREIDLIALAGLLHDIGKFGQRAGNYPLREGAYKVADYHYTHAAYTAQILEEFAFNLGEEMSDVAAMHHHPRSDLDWIVAAADRMASGFERERFDEYNDCFGEESFRTQRLWALFDEKRRYRIDTFEAENIFPVDGEAEEGEYDRLWERFVADLRSVREEGSASVDLFTIDDLLRRYTSFIPSSTTFKKAGYAPVKANIPLYDHSRATAIFAAALYKLSIEEGDDNILRYYRGDPCDIERQDLLYISGDFFGIQDFIFSDLPTAKAAKLLRAKSAYVQLLTRIVAFEIVDRLGLSYQSIVSTHAGKFEILGVNTPRAIDELEKIQRELDDFFVGEYFGTTGIGLSWVGCSLADFIVEGRYRDELRPRIAEGVEMRKFRKFDLQTRDPLLNIDEGIDNRNLCRLCGKKRGRERDGGEYIACDRCDSFIRIGRELTTRGYLGISRISGQMRVYGDYFLNFTDEPRRFDNLVALYDIANDGIFRGVAKWELRSYVKFSEHERRIEELEELAMESCGGGEEGVKALMALKGDVDNMGLFIRSSGVTASFARYNFFARMMDRFFSVYASRLMEREYPDLYTVFAGGDDLFVLGAWDETIAFAKRLRQDFLRFAEGSGLTFSAGMVMSKPQKPVNFLAQSAEKALETAKGVEGKDSVSLFGETVKWEDYLDDLGLSEELERLSEIPMAFLYRLLDFVAMSRRVKERGSIPDTIWKSKFAYTVRRNMEEMPETLFHTLDEMIEKYPRESRMILSETIYRRRKA
ncbi:type III-A CRISPR-associated protein Cas10/Csm1 [Nitratifractor sp.]